MPLRTELVQISEYDQVDIPTRCLRAAATFVRGLPLETGATMLQTLAIILLVLWLLGLVTGTTLGGFIYILLVVAVVLFLVRIISGRRTV